MTANKAHSIVPATRSAVEYNVCREASLRHRLTEQPFVLCRRLTLSSTLSDVNPPVVAVSASCLCEQTVFVT